MIDIQKYKLPFFVTQELEKCSNCGLCHSVCPVYQLSGLETLSARGKINLLKAVETGQLEPGKISRKIFDRCLLCYACKTVCPSGVDTENIWTEARQYFARVTGAGLKGAAVRTAFKADNLKKAAHAAKSLQDFFGIKIGKKGFRPDFADKFLIDVLPDTVPAKWEKRYRIGYFIGCVSNFFLSEIALSAIEVLSAVGCEVVIPKRQVCCGAPAFNNGEMAAAAALAKRNIQVFLEAEVDYVISADATCGGSFVHEYRRLAGDYPLYEEFAAKHREFHSFILEAGLPEKLKAIPSTIVYHDSCHLAHTQGIRIPPRRILQSLPGVKLVEMAHSDICCGFGGSFSLLHAEESSGISRRKLQNAIESGADELAAG